MADDSRSSGANGGGAEASRHARLTSKDVAKLMADRSAETLADTAARMAEDFTAGHLSLEARKEAAEIFRLLVNEAVTMVRAALSDNLKNSADLPHDIALTLAQDVDEVALPMLEFSEVLTDEDLIGIIQTQGEEKQKAVARREGVSEEVSEALVDHGTVEVVTTLVRNKTASISEQTLQKVVDDYGEIEDVQEPLIDRSSLPISVIERLVAKVSERLKETLVAKHELPADMAADLILESREQATVGLVSGRATSDAELLQLVRQLRDHGRLTPSLLLRAACIGDMRFLEAGLSVMVGIPLINASLLINDQGELGFRSIYERAGLPPRLFPAFRAAVDVARETQFDGEPHDQERYTVRMIERFVTQIEDLQDNIAEDDLEYLLGKLERYSKVLSMPRDAG